MGEEPRMEWLRPWPAGLKVSPKGTAKTEAKLCEHAVAVELGVTQPSLGRHVLLHCLDQMQ